MQPSTEQPIAVTASPNPNKPKFTGLTTVVDFLKGKKSYIIGIAMIIISVVKYATGDLTLAQFVTSVEGILGFNGVAVMTLRAAIAKISL